jgi:hypothetical protein
MQHGCKQKLQASSASGRRKFRTFWSLSGAVNQSCTQAKLGCSGDSLLLPFEFCDPKREGKCSCHWSKRAHMMTWLLFHRRHGSRDLLFASKYACFQLRKRIFWRPGQELRKFQALGVAGHCSTLHRVARGCLGGGKLLVQASRNQGKPRNSIRLPGAYALSTKKSYFEMRKKFNKKIYMYIFIIYVRSSSFTKK